MKPLDGKTAFVTGGSKGIGAAIAQRLAQDGADVAFTYNSSPEQAGQVAELIKQEGRRGVAIKADLTDPAAVTAAVEETAAEFGRLDILVHNAGVYTYGTIDELTLDDYEHTMAIHVRAAFLAVQAAVRHMPDGGRIIAIGSNLADRVVEPGISLYALSKAALVGFARGIAHDLGPRGITAVVVQPGSTDTDMNPADSPGADAQRAITPLKRFAAPAEIAATVAHLAGPAGAYITGTAITVDGGANA
ncbi:SDR family NAD(P)-dependent oxidoreductase [Sinosporangium siamense]|uniref:3-oxoacyl-ACP reductase n=1 Tax=Sinosporangium siamense TaxID=1367973 RepID=A0A919RM81_9ACTN|nr:SDR family oxidoreductase [Sinosporangium siamense]GII94721.1 3-oxoacyl-ACP reductase [Sinosporangium siamense]